MFSSMNEQNNGFSAIGQKELEVVNGGSIRLSDLIWIIITRPPRPRPRPKC